MWLKGQYMYIYGLATRDEADRAHDLVTPRYHDTPHRCARKLSEAICSVRVCRLTYRWEASLWLEGRQVYLGGFATEEEAARAYDLAALGCKGGNAEINFRRTDYAATLATDLARLSRVCLILSCLSALAVLMSLAY